MNRLPSRRFTFNVMPYLHRKIRKKKLKSCLLNVLSASRVKEDLKEYGYISFDMVDRNGWAGIYLHCSQAWTVDGWTRVRAVNL